MVGGVQVEVYKSSMDNVIDTPDRLSTFLDCLPRYRFVPSGSGPVRSFEHSNPDGELHAASGRRPATAEHSWDQKRS